MLSLKEMSTVPAAWLCTPSLTCWTGWAANTSRRWSAISRRRRRVLGHTSEYAFAVTEQTINTSILHVSMLRPASGLSEEEKQLAVRYLADSVLQHIDEVQALE